MPASSPQHTSSSPDAIDDDIPAMLFDGVNTQNEHPTGLMNGCRKAGLGEHRTETSTTRSYEQEWPPARFMTQPHS
jgi:hypothetical protein